MIVERDKPGFPPVFFPGEGLGRATHSQLNWARMRSPLEPWPMSRSAAVSSEGECQDLCLIKTYVTHQRCEWIDLSTIKTTGLKSNKTLTKSVNTLSSCK